MFHKRNLVNLRSTRSTCEEDLKILEATVGSLVNSNSSLREENAKLNAEISVLESNYNNLQADLSAYDDIIGNLNLTIEDLRDQVTSLMNENNKLQNELDAEKAKVTSLTNDKNSLTTQLNTANATISSLNSQINSLNSQVTTLTNDNRKLSDMNLRLENDLASANTTILSLNSQVASLTNDKNKLQNDLNTANAEIQRLGSFEFPIILDNYKATFIQNAFNPSFEITLGEYVSKLTVSGAVFKRNGKEFIATTYVGSGFDIETLDGKKIIDVRNYSAHQIFEMTPGQTLSISMYSGKTGDPSNPGVNNLGLLRKGIINIANTDGLDSSTAMAIKDLVNFVKTFM